MVLRKNPRLMGNQTFRLSVFTSVSAETSTGGGLVKMNIRKINTTNAGADKRRDVNVRNVTVSLDNGTMLLESGELKFAYQRRYGLIGENGVGMCYTIYLFFKFSRLFGTSISHLMLSFVFWLAFRIGAFCFVVVCLS